MVKTAKKANISAADFLPKKFTIPSLQAAAKVCKGCHLYKNATQTVFGAGSKNAQLIVVGEQPGLVEDEKGIPFTGPAGIFLRKTIQNNGIDLEDIYLTNVVKHFKFSYLNKRKIHRTPVGTEIRACMPWLNAELQTLQPHAILCLGATAAKALIGKDFKIRSHHGKWLKFGESIAILATFHPSAILRAGDHAAREELKSIFNQDIKKVAIFLLKQKA